MIQPSAKQWLRRNSPILILSGTAIAMVCVVLVGVVIKTRRLEAELQQVISFHERMIKGIDAVAVGNTMIAEMRRLSAEANSKGDDSEASREFEDVIRNVDSTELALAVIEESIWPRGFDAIDMGLNDQSRSPRMPPPAR
jgi:hypothetical protein